MISSIRAECDTIFYATNRMSIISAYHKNTMNVKYFIGWKIAKSTYRKNTVTRQYLQFTNFVIISYNFGLVRSLYDRARGTCTMGGGEERLEEMCENNGYPNWFIRRNSKPQLPMNNTKSEKNVHCLSACHF